MLQVCRPSDAVVKLNSMSCVERCLQNSVKRRANASPDSPVSCTIMKIYIGFIFQVI